MNCRLSHRYTRSFSRIGSCRQDRGEGLCWSLVVKPNCMIFSQSLPKTKVSRRFTRFVSYQSACAHTTEERAFSIQQLQRSSTPKYTLKSTKRPFARCAAPAPRLQPKLREGSAVLSISSGQALSTNRISLYDQVSAVEFFRGGSFLRHSLALPSYVASRRMGASSPLSPRRRHDSRESPPSLSC